VIKTGTPPGALLMRTRSAPLTRCDRSAARRQLPA
jgi:hypothetical protein